MCSSFSWPMATKRWIPEHQISPIRLISSYPWANKSQRNILIIAATILIISNQIPIVDESHINVSKWEKMPEKKARRNGKEIKKESRSFKRLLKYDNWTNSHLNTTMGSAVLPRFGCHTRTEKENEQERKMSRYISALWHCVRYACASYVLTFALSLSYLFRPHSRSASH